MKKQEVNDIFSNFYRVCRFNQRAFEVGRHVVLRRDDEKPFQHGNFFVFKGAKATKNENCFCFPTEHLAELVARFQDRPCVCYRGSKPRGNTFAIAVEQID